MHAPRKAKLLLLRQVIVRAAEDRRPVDLTAILNSVFDAVPRVHIRWSGRARPAFRTCGVVGFAVAILVAVTAALFGGRSILALAQAIGVAVLSFFAWARMRRVITGVERLVLLEHVWFALLTVSAALAWQGLPVTATLDPFCAGLAFFLAGGRTGCLLVGCCHGHPSTIGIRYPPGHASHGFAPYLVNIRLFPVQLLELLGLLLIGVGTFVVVLGAAPGLATIWYLFSYSLLRFALEELRGDERPHVLSMSLPRWMCVAEFMFTMWLAQPAGWLPIGIVVVGLALYLGRDDDRQLLAPSHVDEIRGLLERFPDAERSPTGAIAWSTSRRVTLAISRAAHSELRRGAPALHLSLCLPSRNENLRLACLLAATTFPWLDPDRTFHGPGNILHFILRYPCNHQISNPKVAFERLYRRLLTHSPADVMPAPRPVPPPPVPWYWRTS